MSDGHRRLRANPPGVGDPAPGRTSAPATGREPAAPSVEPLEAQLKPQLEPPLEAPPEPLLEPPLEGFDRVVRLLVVGTGVLAWATAGFLVLIALAMTPRQGLSGGASLFKAADVIAWVVLGALTIRDAIAMRRRTLLVGLGAWAVVFALTWLVGQTANLTVGQGV